MIRSFLYRPGEKIVEHEGIRNFDRLAAEPDSVLWVDLCKPTDEESFILTHDFKFHPLAIEDVISEKTRTKIDDYESYIFFIFQIVDYVGRDEGLKVGEVSMFLSKNTLVTIHWDEHRIFDYLFHRAEKDERMMSRGVDFLFHALVDTLVDNYNTTLDILEYEVDQVEEDVLGQPEAETVKLIFTLRRDIVQLKRIVHPQMEIVNRLSRKEFKLISDRAAMYFSDIHDHLLRVNDIADSHRDLLHTSLEVYFSSVSTRTNDIVKVLTMFTVLSIPPLFLVGLWGMNFDFMPELHWKYGYAFAWAVMLGLVLVMVIYFRRKKWL